ncbi:hypothetical protein ES703_63737 [subsurface metagenome]
MYQFSEQDDYLVDTIKRFFQSPTYHVFDAREEVGLGIKICKICRLVQASDFGIMVLTPENPNAYLETGMMMGMGKRNLYIVSRNILKAQKKNLKDIAFDLSDQLVIEHGDEKELLRKLEKEVPPFIENVIIGTALERERRTYWRSIYNELDDLDKIILRFLLIVSVYRGDRSFYNLWKKASSLHNSPPDDRIRANQLAATHQKLWDLKILKIEVIDASTRDWFIDKTAAPYFQEFLFEEE